MKLALEHDGSLTPESRGTILAEVLHFMAAMMEPVPYGRLLEHVIGSFAAQEEHVSSTVMHAVQKLISGGFVTSNGYHVLGGEISMTFTADTTISPSRKLTSFVFGEHA
jgi:hypothetical protein